MLEIGSQVGYQDMDGEYTAALLRSGHERQRWGKILQVGTGLGGISSQKILDWQR
jgi:hypothetical protein